MKKQAYIAILILLVSCSSLNRNYTRLSIIEKVRNGYSVRLNSKPIDFEFTYLDRENISEIRHLNSKKTIEIRTKNQPEFFSMKDVFYTYNVKTQPDIVTIDGISIDNLNLAKLKFEKKSISDFRLLTQKDYAGKEFDGMDSLKQTIGNGLVVISIK